MSLSLCLSVFLVLSFSFCLSRSVSVFLFLDISTKKRRNVIQQSYTFNFGTSQQKVKYSWQNVCQDGQVKFDSLVPTPTHSHFTWMNPVQSRTHHLLVHLSKDRLDEKREGGWCGSTCRSLCKDSEHTFHFDESTKVKYNWHVNLIHFTCLCILSEVNKESFYVDEWNTVVRWKEYLKQDDAYSSRDELVSSQEPREREGEREMEREKGRSREMEREREERERKFEAQSLAPFLPPVSLSWWKGLWEAFTFQQSA